MELDTQVVVQCQTEPLFPPPQMNLGVQWERGQTFALMEAKTAC